MDSKVILECKTNNNGAVEETMGFVLNPDSNETIESYSSSAIRRLIKTDYLRKNRNIRFAKNSYMFDLITLDGEARKEYQLEAILPKEIVRIANYNAIKYELNKMVDMMIKKIKEGEIIR